MPTRSRTDYERPGPLTMSCLLVSRKSLISALTCALVYVVSCLSVANFFLVFRDGLQTVPYGYSRYNGTAENNSTELPLDVTDSTHRGPTVKESNPASNERYSYKTFNFTNYFEDVVYAKQVVNRLHKQVHSDAKKAAEQRAQRIREQKEQVKFYQNRKVKINNFPYNFIYECLLVCQPTPDIVVLVNSRHASYDKRSAIRDTWGGAIKKMKWLGKNISSKIALAFVLGMPINKTGLEAVQRESDVFHDIILGDFIDNYSNMTLKSLLAMQWAATHCSGARYFVKSDDDMFINIPHLIGVLQRLKLRRVIMGPHCPASVVLRYGKWAVPQKAYPFSQYPPYEAGSAYVMSMDIVRPLFDASFYFTHFSVDDAFITGVLAKFIGANHAHQGGFSYEGTRKPASCDIHKNRRVTGHGFTASQLRQFWTSLSMSNGTICR